MFPDQQNQNSGQGGYGVGPVPSGHQPLPQTPQNVVPQPNQNGQYEVVPPLPVGQNSGHTGHNPYEFIVNPNAPKRRAGIGFGGSGFGMRIAVIVGGVVVLMIIAAVLLSAFGPKSNTADLIAIAQRQQEIIRIATTATQQASGQDAKNFATTAGLSVASDQQQTLAYLAKAGKKLNAKTLALDQNTQTDTLLQNAANAGTYDSTVVSTLNSQLQTYQSLLQKTYKETTSVAAKHVLQTNFTNANKLLVQAKDLSGASSD